MRVTTIDTHPNRATLTDTTRDIQKNMHAGKWMSCEQTNRYSN